MSSNADSRKEKPAIVDEEEDLDEFDDVLDQFQVPTKLSTSKQQKTSNVEEKDAEDSGSLHDEFSAELAAGMEEMLKNLSMETSNNVTGESIDDTRLSEEEKQFRRLWEQMLVDGMNGKEDSEAGQQLDAILADAFKDSGSKPPQAPSAPKASDSKPAPGSNESFQNAIRQAMEKLKSSDETLNSDVDPSDPLAQLLSQFGDLSGEDANKMDSVIEEMLGAIMSKDVLYEPMKELSGQYPGYLSSHPEISAADRKRYEEQLQISTKIIEVFDRPGYSDDDVKTQAEVFRLMNEMQTLGSPPAEVMGELPDGLTPEALASGEGCVIS